jgi:SAM-dependent methyltransferase
MLSHVKKLYRSIVHDLPELTKAVKRIDMQLQNIAASPIDRHIALGSFYNQEGLFRERYDEWRIKRINKILELYGIDYFKGRTILELGSGLGDIGAFFAELGATTLCLDGRIQNVNFANLKHRKIPNFKCQHFNLEHDFSEFGKFDLILNFGLLYHLKNVDSHLACCFKMSDDMLLETVVCDSTDPYKICFCDEDKSINEESLEGTGSRPSPFYVERIAGEHSFEVLRYFTDDLNIDNLYSYSWKHDTGEHPGDNYRLRRFWRLKKRQAPAS